MPNCSYCAGWGQVEEYDPYSRHPEDCIIITCPKCLGSGRVPDDCDDDDAFDALCNLPERELARYIGVALEADAETMEVETMLIRANNVFFVGDCIIKFELDWREERLYLDIKTAPHALDHIETVWVFLTAYQVPEHFDFERFLNAFWREIRQGHYINVADLVYEAIGGVK